MERIRGTNRALKLVLSICFLLILVALILIDGSSPATGYELSVYSSLPPLTWACLIAALSIATGVIVHQALREHRSPYWLLGFAALIFGTSIILLLPAFRGYYLYGSADTGAHSMYAELIASEAHLWQGDNYPITHVLAGQISQLSGARPETVNLYVPALFTALFMLFSYLLARSVLPRKGQALLAAAAIAMFFNYYHVCVYPQTLAIMLLPLAFYLYFQGFRSGAVAFKVAFVTVLLWFPYSHPATAAALIVGFVSAEVAKLIWGLRARAEPATAGKGRGLDPITWGPTLISSITFLTWISAYEIFGATIRRTLGWLRGDISEVVHVEILEKALQEQQLNIFQQAALVLKLYGDNLIYLSLSAIALLLIAWAWWRRRHEVNKLFTLSLPFLVSGPVWVLIFVTTLRVTVGRLLGANIMMWATPVFASFALHEVFTRWKRAGLLVVAPILVFGSVIGIFAVYQSPYTLQVSWQVTRQDVEGSRWFKNHTQLPRNYWFAALGNPVATTGYGTEGRIPLPDHFGYPEHQTLGSVLRGDIYLVLGERQLLGSSDATLAKFTTSAPHLYTTGYDPADFQRLQLDPTVRRLYSNGEFEVLQTTGES